VLRRRDDPLREILAASGRGVIDAVLPSAAFVVVWLGASALGWWEPILLGGLASVLVALVVAVVRWRGGERPRAAAVGLLLAVGATLIALYTGRAEDFFLPRIVANAGSLAAWLVSIAVRWPLLGVVVGTLLGQKTRWRRHPALLRAYSVASWAWVGQYVLRVAVFTPLWLDAQIFWLAGLRVALSWPLQIVCVLVSGWLLRRALPADHPGFRHPRTQANSTT